MESKAGLPACPNRSSGKSFQLPSRESIRASAGVDQDPLPYYYLPVIGSFYRRRLTVALEMMGDASFGSLLEVGYGSGLLLPELGRRCGKLTAIDVHHNVQPVHEFLRRHGAAAELHAGTVTDLPFKNESFDCIVCLSVLEHVIDLDRAILEIRRVLTPDGIAIIGVPTRNIISATLIRLLGFNPSEQHPNDHNLLLARFRTLFPAERMQLIPAFLPPQLGLYVVLRCARSGGLA